MDDVIKADALCPSDNGNICSDAQNGQFSDTKCEDKTQDVQINADIDINVNEPKNIYGKFKDPQELIKAYGELEREFTKKSQKLKELEARVKPYESEEEWRQATDKFFQKTPTAVAFKREIADEILRDPSLRQDRNCFDKALVRVLAKKFRTPEQIMSDGQFLKEYVLSSDELKEAVVKNYLDSLKSAAPPRTLTGGGAQCVAPAKRPRTIEEAGIMFLRDNK